MTRLIFSLTLVIAALFMAAFAALRALAWTFDAHDGVTVWLGTETAACRLPCWRAIMPGETPANTALLTLMQMSDVTAITDTPTSSSLLGAASYIHWRWRDQAAAQLDTTHGLLIVEEGVVQEIYMALPARAGDLRLAFGAPTGGEASFVESYGRRGEMLHTMVYSAHGLSVLSYIDCPITLPRAWTPPIYVWLRRTDDVRFPYLVGTDYLQRRALMLVLGRREYC
jgi:hypothetical protein